jgi:hypothetical protein
MPVAAVLLSGCYTYQPLTRPTPEAGAEVRATLAQPVPLQVGDLTIHDVDRIEGQVHSADGDTVRVWGAWLHTRSGGRHSANGGSLALPRDRIATIEQRRLSPARSALAALVVGGVVAALFTLVEGALGGSGNSGQPPQPY